MTLFAFFFNAFVGRKRMGMPAKMYFVHQLVFANTELHNQMRSSWFVQNWAPSVNHFTLIWTSIHGQKQSGQRQKTTLQRLTWETGVCSIAIRRLWKGGIVQPSPGHQGRWNWAGLDWFGHTLLPSKKKTHKSVVGDCIQKTELLDGSQPILFQQSSNIRGNPLVWLQCTRPTAPRFFCSTKHVEHRTPTK